MADPARICRHGAAGTCRRPLPRQGRPRRRRRHTEDAGDRARDPGRRVGVSEAPVPHDRLHPDPPRGHRVRQFGRDRETGWHRGAVVRCERNVPDDGVHRRLLPVRAHRLHRHDAGDAGQRAHRGRGAWRQDGPSAPDRVPNRRRRRHVLRRPRPARSDGHHDDLPEHVVGDPHRVRVRRVAARPVPPRRRWHLHQGGRRRRRPRRQGRGRHPGRRPAQPGNDRRQRRRQRRRLRRHGLRPVRELRGHARCLDHPRCAGVQVDLPRPTGASGRPARCSRSRPEPSVCSRRSSACSPCGRPTRTSRRWPRSTAASSPPA